MELDIEKLNKGNYFASDWELNEEEIKKFELKPNNGEGIMAQINNSAYNPITLRDLNIERLNEFWRDVENSRQKGIVLPKSTYDLLIHRLNYEQILSDEYMMVRRSIRELLYEIEVIETAMEYLTGERTD